MTLILPSSQTVAFRRRWCVVTTVLKNLNCKLFMRWTFAHVVSVGRGLWHPCSELQKAEIVFSRHSLLQNLSTFNVGYVRTSGAATKCEYMYRHGLNFERTSQARGSHETKMRKLFLGKCDSFLILFGVRTLFIYMLLYIHIPRLNANISVDFTKDRLCTILYLSFLLGSVPVTPNLLFNWIFYFTS